MRATPPLPAEPPRPLTLTGALLLLRRHDWSCNQPDPKREPEVWIIGTKRMTEAEMVAMAERIRQREGARP